MLLTEFNADLIRDILSDSEIESDIMLMLLDDTNRSRVTIPSLLAKHRIHRKVFNAALERATRRVKTFLEKRGVRSTADIDYPTQRLSHEGMMSRSKKRKVEAL